MQKKVMASSDPTSVYHVMGRIGGTARTREQWQQPLANPSDSPPASHKNHTVSTKTSAHSVKPIIPGTSYATCTALSSASVNTGKGQGTTHEGFP